MKIHQTPLLRAMRERQLSLGNYCTINSPEIMEVVGYCGFNHVILDHMFTGLDWQATSHMIRAAQLFGVCPIVRVQTYLWGSRGKDTRMASEVARALGIGAGGAMVSVGSLEELDSCLGVQRDAHHKRIWISPDVAEIEKAGGHLIDEDDQFFVVPLIETPELIDRIEEMVELDGLKAIAVGIHDVCMAVGHPYDVDHLEVWKLVDKISAAAGPKGIDTWVNVGYRFTRIDEMVDRIGRMLDHGIRTVQVQGPETLLQHMLKQIRLGADEQMSKR
jgi:2-keto-3-deoxy-L-rhamnonate aldolase RhmA